MILYPIVLIVVCRAFATNVIQKSMDECSKSGINFTQDSNSCVFDRLKQNWHMFNPQMSKEQYMYIASKISRGFCQGKCNLLVFGVGYDVPLWLNANKHGRTVFIEQSEEWSRKIKAEIGGEIEVHLIEYHTQLKKLAEEIDDVDRHLDNFLPPNLLSVVWTVILIDAPTGYCSSCPGRLQPVLYASKHVAKNNIGIDVFLHDMNRLGEREMGNQLLSFPHQKHPTIIRSANPQQAPLAHWHFKANDQTFARRLLHAPKQFGVVFILVSTRSADDQERDCAEQLLQKCVTSLQKSGVENNDIVVFSVENERGIQHSVPYGKYSSEGFRQATLLKTRVVLTAIRFGIDVLLTDLDIHFTDQFDPRIIKTWNLWQSFSETAFVIQQEYQRRCTFAVNTGFYAAKARTSAAKHLSKVVHHANKVKCTEQQAWDAILKPKYQKQIMSQCIDPTTYKLNNLESFIQLLPVNEYTNGFWQAPHGNNETLFREMIQKSKVVHFNYLIGNCVKLTRRNKFFPA